MDVVEGMSSEALGVQDEAERAWLKYGDFTSTHEAYGVLAEEVAELLVGIRSNDVNSIMQEARQVSAVAMRLAEICHRERLGKAAEFGERSGL